jgi:protein subunit release factor B
MRAGIIAEHDNWISRDLMCHISDWWCGINWQPLDWVQNIWYSRWTVDKVAGKQAGWRDAKVSCAWGYKAAGVKLKCQVHTFVCTNHWRVQINQSNCLIAAVHKISNLNKT